MRTHLFIESSEKDIIITSGTDSVQRIRGGGGEPFGWV